MGRVFSIVFEEDIVYSCKHCKNHLALVDELVSANFNTRQGQGYLFTRVWNVFPGQQEERKMSTGSYIVADIFCVCCASCVGWRYKTAYESDQQYKEGKSVLQRDMLSGPYDSDYTFSEASSTSSEESDLESH